MPDLFREELLTPAEIKAIRAEQDEKLIIPALDKIAAELKAHYRGKPLKIELDLPADDFKDIADELNSRLAEKGWLAVHVNHVACVEGKCTVTLSELDAY